MTLIDDRGRLFARWNVIDVATLVGVFVLLALSYGAVLLFRTPVPVIASITPAQILEKQPVTLSISGEHLRPFLRVRLGPLTAPLAVVSPASAQVRVEGLPPGTYDVVLLDEARELVRVGRALIVTARPTTRVEMHAVGTFVRLTAQDAEHIRPGITFDEAFPPVGSPAEFGPASRAAVGEVLAVRPPEVSTQRLRVSETAVITMLVPEMIQMPAIVGFRCEVMVDRCRIGGVDVLPDALVPLTLSALQRQNVTYPVTSFMFRIDELRPATAPLTFESATVTTATMEMHAVGDFIYLSREEAEEVRTGSQFERPRAVASEAHLNDDVTVAHVLTARPPETGTVQVRVGDGPNAMVTSPVPNTWQVPAIIRLRCVVAGNQCRIGDANVSQGAIIPLAVPVGPGDRFARPAPTLLFRVGRLGPVEAQVAFPSVVTTDAVVRVKFLARPEVAGLPMAGDEDLGVPAGENTAEAKPDTRSARAAIVSVDTEPQRVVATTQTERTTFQEMMVTFEGTLKVPVTLTSIGWQYAGRLVKVGAPFKFEGRTYAMDGWVLDVQVGHERRNPAR